MESIYTELALYGSKNECARTDTVFLPISEVCNGTVSLLCHVEQSTDLWTNLDAIGPFESVIFFVLRCCVICCPKRLRHFFYPRGCVIIMSQEVFFVHRGYVIFLSKEVVGFFLQEVV